ncbi:MAG: ribosomal-protein-alanine N-acetyltransferase [Chloroflexi bacterium RBG_16_50_11]|nr:MAG: ribosomal-protein-alanine N-acetyltransferase [Chloroflexi bacterium RBG_16_50_11]
MPYFIRPMVKEDIDQVSEIDHEAFPSQWPPANYRQEMQNNIAHYLVACDNAKTVSMPATLPPKKSDLISRLMPWRRQQPMKNKSLPPVAVPYIAGFSGIWMMADEAHITNLAVRRQYQGKGLGQMLLIATIDLAVGLKASFMTLEVRASNLTAQSLYAKYGFTQMGIRRGYYLDNREDAIIMSTDTLNSPPFQERIKELREALKQKLA